MKKHLIFRSILALALVLVLVSSVAMAETVQFIKNSRVYQQPNANSKYMSVKKGLQCELISVSGGIATVQRKGYTGYAPYAHLKTVSGTQGDWGQIWGDDTNPSFTPTSTAAYINTICKIYKAPSTAAASMTCPAGINVTITGYDEVTGWARITAKGYTAYIYYQNLTLGTYGGGILGGGTPNPDIGNGGGNGTFTLGGPITESNFADFWEWYSDANTPDFKAKGQIPVYSTPGGSFIGYITAGTTGAYTTATVGGYCVVIANNGIYGYTLISYFS